VAICLFLIGLSPGVVLLAGSGWTYVGNWLAVAYLGWVFTVLAYSLWTGLLKLHPTRIGALVQPFLCRPDRWCRPAGRTITPGGGQALRWSWPRWLLIVLGGREPRCGTALTFFRRY
jgi:hypothetical protein